MYESPRKNSRGVCVAEQNASKVAEKKATKSSQPHTDVIDSSSFDNFDVADRKDAVNQTITPLKCLDMIARGSASWQNLKACHATRDTIDIDSISSGEEITLETCTADSQASGADCGAFACQLKHSLMKDMYAQTKLPPDLVLCSKPNFDIFGTSQDPIVHLRNVDGSQGRLVVEHVMNEMVRLGKKLPMPHRGKRGGITVEWHRNKQSQTPWRTGIRVLSDMADQVLNFLRQDQQVVQQVPALRELDRGWNDTEILVTTPGCYLGRHRDAQPPGSLLLVFCAGLSCISHSWPGGNFSERKLESGDVMILDAAVIAHAVPGLLENTSPLHYDWLRQRRLAILLRQCSPPGARCFRRRMRSSVTAKRDPSFSDKGEAAKKVPVKGVRLGSHLQGGDICAMPREGDLSKREMEALENLEKERGLKNIVSQKQACNEAEHVAVQSPRHLAPELHSGMFREQTIQAVNRLQTKLREIVKKCGSSASTTDRILEVLEELHDYAVDAYVLKHTEIDKEMGALREHVSHSVVKEIDELTFQWRRDLDIRLKVVEGFQKKGNVNPAHAQIMEERLFHMTCPLGILEGEHYQLYQQHYRLYRRHFKRLSSHSRCTRVGSIAQTLEFCDSDAALESDTNFMTEEEEQTHKSRKKTKKSRKKKRKRQDDASDYELGSDSDTARSCRCMNCRARMIAAVYAGRSAPDDLD